MSEFVATSACHLVYTIGTAALNPEMALPTMHTSRGRQSIFWSVQESLRRRMFGHATQLGIDPRPENCRQIIDNCEQLNVAPDDNYGLFSHIQFRNLCWDTSNPVLGLGNYLHNINKHARWKNRRAVRFVDYGHEAFIPGSVCGAGCEELLKLVILVASFWKSDHYIHWRHIDDKGWRETTALRDSPSSLSPFAHYQTSYLLHSWHDPGWGLMLVWTSSFLSQRRDARLTFQRWVSYEQRSLPPNSNQIFGWNTCY